MFENLELFLRPVFAGTAFSFGTQDPTIYREYTIGPPSAILITMLSVVPIATTVLALTNPMHNIICSIIETESGPRFTDLTEHYWFNRVHAPFMYGLFIYSVISLMSRLPTIAPAHRKTIVIIVLCAMLPFAVSVADNYLSLGPADFPFTPLAMVLLLPLYWYVSITLRFYEFSPLAYETLFHHVRDAIICTNKSAQEFLGASEKELLGATTQEEFSAGT